VAVVVGLFLILTPLAVLALAWMQRYALKRIIAAQEAAAEKVAETVLARNDADKADLDAKLERILQRLDG